MGYILIFFAEIVPNCYLTMFVVWSVHKSSYVNKLYVRPRLLFLVLIQVYTSVTIIDDMEVEIF